VSIQGEVLRGNGRLSPNHVLTGQEYKIIRFKSQYNTLRKLSIILIYLIYVAKHKFRKAGGGLGEGTESRCRSTKPASDECE
jgi:hypothetical protein